MRGKQLSHKPIKNFVDLWHSIFTVFILYLLHEKQLVERMSYTFNVKKINSGGIIKWQVYL